MCIRDRFLSESRCACTEESGCRIHETFAECDAFSKAFHAVFIIYFINCTQEVLRVNDSEKMDLILNIGMEISEQMKAANGRMEVMEGGMSTLSEQRCV